MLGYATRSGEFSKFRQGDLVARSAAWASPAAVDPNQVALQLNQNRGLKGMRRCCETFES
jgi:hypothetical protein